MAHVASLGLRELEPVNCNEIKPGHDLYVAPIFP
jgi:hypothetical protein